MDTVFFYTETNRITYFDLLLPATFTWRVNVKTIHPMRAHQHEDSSRRSYSVGSMHVSNNGSASSTCHLLTRPRRRDSSLYRVVVASGKNYGWEGYKTKKQQVHSQVSETDCGIPFHPYPPGALAVFFPYSLAHDNYAPEHQLSLTRDCTNCDPARRGLPPLMHGQCGRPLGLPQS